MDAKWEDMTDFKHAFPDFTLEDKSPVEVGVASGKASAATKRYREENSKIS